MNVYEKLQKIKVELLSCKLKKTGKNKFAGFDYYELSDIMPDIIRLCDKYKVYTSINFKADHAELLAVNCESDADKIEAITIFAPTTTLEIRGANPIQALGGIQTYMRRYLYMAMFDITENDQFDAITGKADSKPKEYKCVDCKTDFKGVTAKDGKKYNAGQVFHIAESHSPDKKARCSACLKKFKEQ